MRWRTEEVLEDGMMENRDGSPFRYLKKCLYFTNLSCEALHTLFAVTSDAELWLHCNNTVSHKIHTLL
jgi:hypothetical protein